MATCGAFHTLVVAETGELFAWGAGLDFQLGLHDDDNRLLPAQVDPEAFEQARVLMAAGGGAFSAAVTEGGGLFTFGEGGPWLGHGHDAPDFSSPQKSPARVRAELFNGDKVVMTSCGTLHQAAVTEVGQVYCWGQGGPRLGEHLFLSCLLFTVSHDTRHLAYQNPRAGVGDADSRPVPVRLAPDFFHGETVLQISCGSVHTAAVTHSGVLYTWGFGGEGRLGHGDTAMRMQPTQVMAIGQRFGTGPKRARVLMVCGGGFHTGEFSFIISPSLEESLTLYE